MSSSMAASASLQDRRRARRTWAKGTQDRARLTACSSRVADARAAAEAEAEAEEEDEEDAVVEEAEGEEEEEVDRISMAGPTRVGSSCTLRTLL